MGNSRSGDVGDSTVAGIAVEVVRDSVAASDSDRTDQVSRGMSYAVLSVRWTTRSRRTLRAVCMEDVTTQADHVHNVSERLRVELLSAEEPPLDSALEAGLFDDHNLAIDLDACLNAAEMGKRQFREIARISGLVFQGYPGQQKSAKQLQASSGLLYDVFSNYDPNNDCCDNRESRSWNASWNTHDCSRRFNRFVPANWCEKLRNDSLRWRFPSSWLVFEND